MNTRIRTIALAATLALGPGSAGAELARVGPINSANGYPQWYQDKSGVTMDFCQNATQAELSGGWCVLLPADIPSGTAPEVFPSNFGEEHFFWLGNAGDRKATIPGTQGTTTILLDLGLEGAFSTGPVVPGNQMVFGRVRVKLIPVPYDGDYTFYTPFGKFVFTNQVANQPRGIFFTEDVGLTPGNFVEALGGRVGPFLLPSLQPGGSEVPAIPDLLPGQDGFYDTLVATGAATPYPNNGRRYIADPARLGPVTGSPLPPYVLADGTKLNPNVFRVEGPNGFVYQTTDFTVAGRLFEGAITGDVHVKRASYARSAATGNRVDVYATASPAAQARLPAAPPSAVVASQLAYYDAGCSSAGTDTFGNPIPPFGPPAGAGSQSTQMFATGSNYHGNSAPASIGTEVCVQANAVTSAGQAVTSYIPAPLGDQIFITEALYDASTQAMSIKAVSSDKVKAQTLTADGFGDLDATGKLVVQQQLGAPESVTLVSSGGGRNQRQVAPGTVAAGTGGLPVATNDTITIFEDCQPTTPATGSTQCTMPQVINVLGNDTNTTGTTITVAVTSPATLGTATANADGTIGYIPKLNASGTDTFSYAVTVDGKTSNTASVAVTITPVNDPPVAANDTVGGVRGIATSVNVLANDADPDGAADLAGAKIVTGNTNLGLTAGATFNGGSVTFTPASGMATGPATFTYVAVDRLGAQSALPATVTVNVSAGEALAPSKAIYTQKTGRWTLTGVASPAAGQTITAAYTNGTYKVNGQCTGNAAGAVIATAVVDALGNWNYDQILTNTSGVVNPGNSLGNSSGFWCQQPSTVRFTSSQSPASATFAIQLK